MSTLLQNIHIGIDFDNTIVSYDDVFYRVALEQGIVPASIEPTKLSVRNWLRKNGQEDLWTEMQGYVYGARMADATTFPGVHEFFSWTRCSRIPVSIISHKTEKPFMGPAYDLHKAAMIWIDTFLRNDSGPLIDPSHVYFETTKEKKWSRIASAAVTHFIDDLPEILFAKSFPDGVKRILFDPEQHHNISENDVVTARTWTDILLYFT